MQLKSDGLFHMNEQCRELSHNTLGFAVTLYRISGVCEHFCDTWTMEMIMSRVINQLGMILN